jgi:hypothetical protein
MMGLARWLLGATSDSVFQGPTVQGENEMQPIHGLDELEAQTRMTWSEARPGGPPRRTTSWKRSREAGTRREAATERR